MVKWVWLLYILQGLKNDELPFVWAQLHGHIFKDGQNTLPMLHLNSNNVLFT